MCWVPNRRLWRKVYRGKVYMISCRQLRELGYDQGPNALLIDDTKTGSYVAANSWWAKKEHELEAERRKTERQPTAMEQLVLAYANVPPEQWPEALRNCDETGQIVVPGETPLDPDVHPINPLKLVQMLLVNRVFMAGEPLPEHMTQHLPPARLQQATEAVKSFRGESAVEPDRTVGAYVNSWIKLKEAQVAVGQLTTTRFEGLCIYVGYFRDYLGADSAVESVDAAKLQGFYSWCLDKVRQQQQDPKGKAGWSNSYAKQVFEAGKVFVRYLSEYDLIALPKNIQSRGFKFNVRAKAIETWTAEEFQTVLAKATGQLPLHLLLMANCGMVQQDISDLLNTEVEWNADGTAERIIRKRSKTKGHGNVPVVNYKLWPTTAALLTKWRSRETPQVLRTKTGGLWKRADLVNGKVIRSDNIATNYNDQKARLEFKKSLKLIRKMGATLLDRHPEYHRFSKLYLGHAPDSIKDRHYADVPKDEFDKAVTWLGQQLGQVGGGEAGPTDVERGPGSDL
jgi:hypothetical protein